MTPLISFHHADTPAVLARDLATWVAQRLRDGLAERGRAMLIVSGGSTPIPFFEALANEVLDWGKVHVVLADERWVSPQHPDSNEALVRRHLLKGGAALARYVPLFNGATTPALACERVATALSSLPWPADVVVLGMGGDGHTASLFPGDPGLAEPSLPSTAGYPRCRAVAAPALPNVPVPRLTLTSQALLDARHVVIHVTGEAKLALLRQAMHDGPLTQWPIRIALLQDKVPCEVFHAS